MALTRHKNLSSSTQLMESRSDSTGNYLKCKSYSEGLCDEPWNVGENARFPAPSILYLIRVKALCLFS